MALRSMENWRTEAPKRTEHTEYSDANFGQHEFRHPIPEFNQRRCASCGFWETATSRARACDPTVWNGAPE